MYHSIRVQDPSHALNQMFVLLKAEGLLHSQEGKDAYAYNVTMGNTWAQMLSQAPVLTTPSTENFFKLFSEYAAFVEQWEAELCGYTFPRFDGFAVTDRFASASLLSSYALGEETLRRPLPKTARKARGCSPRRWWTSEALILAAGLPVGYIIPGRTAATTWHTRHGGHRAKDTSSNGRASSPNALERSPILRVS